MKISQSVVWMVCFAGLAAGALMVGSWSWGLRSEADLRLGSALALEARDRVLRLEIEAGTRRTRELSDSLQDLSNRMAEATCRLADEEKTHDPLRRQIEQMVAEQMRVKDKARQRDTAFAEMEASLAGLRKTNEVWRVQSEERRQRIETLESELKEAETRAAALRTQLESALNDAARMKTPLESRPPTVSGP